MSGTILRTKVLSQLFYSDPRHQAEYSDVKLISSEGECFYTNRLVLSSASQLFYHIFLDSETVGEDVACVFADFGSDTIKNVLEFVSRGFVFGAKTVDGSFDRRVLQDFLSFGIDLSSLVLSPGSDFDFAKSCEPLSSLSFLNNIEVKTEVIDEADYNALNFLAENFLQDPEEVPLARKKKIKKKTVPIKKSTKKKLLTNETEKLQPTRKSTRTVTRSKRFDDSDDEEEEDSSDSDDVSDEEFSADDRDDDDDDDDGGKPEKKRRKLSRDPDFKPANTPSRIKTEQDGEDGVQRRVYKRREFVEKTDGERNPHKRHQCPHCLAGYNSLKQFQLHVARHETGDNEAVFCFLCPPYAKFETVEELKRHKREFHHGQNFTCERFVFLLVRDFFIPWLCYCPRQLMPFRQMVLLMPNSIKRGGSNLRYHEFGPYDFSVMRTPKPPLRPKCSWVDKFDLVLLEGMTP